ncbi:MAG: hypothetical protein HY360_04500 [Verrucomicrobia bacterium]|nr:hypothetical protein [Verrucomicrobiota bacterium]
MKNLHSGFGEHTRLACPVGRLAQQPAPVHHGPPRQILWRKKSATTCGWQAGRRFWTSRLEGDRRLPPLTAVETRALPIPLSDFYRTVVILVLLATVAHAEELISNVKPLPLTPIEQDALTAEKIHRIPLPFTPYNLQMPREPHRVEIFGDRKVYLADDPVGQFLICFIGQDYSSAGVKLVLEVLQGDKVLGSQEIAPVATPKLSLLVNTAALAPGSHRLRARLVGGNQYRAIPDYEFQKSAEKHNSVKLPAEGIPLVVHSQTNVPDAIWPITTGIPLPRGRSESLDQLVLHENGKPVPAQFSQRATWYPNGQLKWVGLDFLAKFDNGKPREYRVKVLPNAPAARKSPISMQETGAKLAIDTGKLRFTVDRKHFAGVEDAWLGNDQIVRGGGGPFLVDERGERFEAANDENAVVEVEESGPVRVTIHAAGWYASAKTKEKLCIFDTRINAYAGQARLDISQRTIITYDTDKEKKLADVGFTVKHADASRWQLGADGRVLLGEGAAWIHQDRWNHFRMVAGDKPAGEGKQSDGWAAQVLKPGSLIVAVRNFWQLYPKELELARNATTLHFWPKHGRVAFTDAEALARLNIHKIFYGHEGSLLDLKFPPKYHVGMTNIFNTIERQTENAVEANGQGLAMGNEFCLSFEASDKTDDIARQAALYQNPPHAIADPVWTSKTETEGRFAPSDRNKYPNTEKVLVDGYYGSHVSSVNVGEHFGLWIWPDTHNNWDPESKLPEWHRWWLNTHYQGGYVNWLMYLRSGDPRLYRWACDNGAHIMNVSTVNYDDPKAPLMGHIAGAMYHVKGFLPWGSEAYGHPKGDDYVEVSAHFINPDAFIMAWLLTGDQRGRALMEAWGRAINRVALAPERSRETCVTLGEMLNYHAVTWDPQALLYIKELADMMMSRPVMEIPAATGHPFFHQQWVRRYWEQTRDERIVAWLKECSAMNKGTTGFAHLDAMLWQWTGDKSYLTNHLRSAAAQWQFLYWNPGDPLDGFGLGCVDRSWAPQALAYYQQALIDAGITTPTDESLAAPAPATMAVPKKENFSPAGWALSGWATGLAYLQTKGADPTVQLEFSAVKSQYGYGPALIGGPFPVYVRIHDADGKLIVEETYLPGSRRPSVTATLDARKNKAPWKFYKGGARMSMKWDGAAEALFIAPTPAEAQKATVAAK